MKAGGEDIVRRSARALWRARVKLAAWAGVAVFLWAVAGFYNEDTGFTSLLSIGEKLGEPVAALRGVPHYVYEDSYGYDGAYYVQLAMYPTVAAPELRGKIDNLSYRARRMLLCWVAWGAGLGRPAWIVQAFALLNVVSWLALAWLLQRWFPLVSWANLIRWAGVLFSHGVCMSVRNSLADTPSLLLVALAVACLERGRRPGGVAWLAAAALCKETSLLATTALVQPSARIGRGWLRLAGQAVLVVLPLAGWMAYLRWRVGPTNDAGLGNFTWPLAGLVEKWGALLAALSASPGWFWLMAASLATTLGITIQLVFVAVRWRPGDIWWRVGASFAVLTLFVAQPVWEGYPGAASRVLLPMALAFNVLVPRGRRWLPVLLAGNLSVLGGVLELGSAPVEFFCVRGERAAVAAVTVTRGENWYPVETDSGHRWRWSQGHGSLRLVNRSTASLQVRLAGTVVPATPRRLTLKVRDEQVLRSDPTAGAVKLTAVAFVLPPGESRLEFDSDRPPVKDLKGDARPLALAVYDLVISVAPAAPSPPP